MDSAALNGKDQPSPSQVCTILETAQGAVASALKNICAFLCDGGRPPSFEGRVAGMFPGLVGGLFVAFVAMEHWRTATPQLWSSDMQSQLDGLYQSMAVVARCEDSLLRFSSMRGYLNL